MEPIGRVVSRLVKRGKGLFGVRGGVSGSTGSVGKRKALQIAERKVWERVLVGSYPTN